MQHQQKRTWIHTLLLAAVLPVGLAACGKGESVQEMVGLTRTGPDAFNVVARPPLSVPPEFDLRPPAPVGTPGPGMPRMDEVARGLLTGDDSAADTAVIGVGSAALESTGERHFMERFGVTKADPMIREQLTTDQYFKPEEEEESWLNDIIPSLRDKKKPDELDPIEEARKLREDGELKDALQAPPEDFLKKAEGDKKKATSAAKDAAEDDVIEIKNDDTATKLDPSLAPTLDADQE
jgi:hypothetical protein